MKKLYNLWILALTMVWATACTPEVDDVFDHSAASRINEAIANCQKILKSASNGWVLNYYPATTKEYGGYTMLIRFTEGGQAEVSCDLFKADKKGTGLYDVVNSSGPMLTFNTYNEIFHFFTEPANTLGIGENGTGMEGDSDFLILSCTEQEVVLKGKKTGNKMSMHPLAEGVAWIDYLTGIKKITSEAYPALYEVVINDQVQYTVTQRYHNFILENADGSQVNLPFHYTQEGISFNESLSLSTLNVKNLRWDKDNMRFTSDQLMIRAKTLPETYSRYNKYLGEYIFLYNNGNTTVPVTLEEELFNESYIMKGFPMDIRVRYKATTGSIEITAQPLTDNAKLYAWSLNNEGYLTNTQGVGMEGYLEVSQSGNQSIQTVTLKDNGVWKNYLCDSFVVLDDTTGSTVLQLGYVNGFMRQITEEENPQP